MLWVFIVVLPLVCAICSNSISWYKNKNSGQVVRYSFFVYMNKFTFSSQEMKNPFDPFVSEITISPQDLRQMLDGILQVLLPVSYLRLISRRLLLEISAIIR